MNRMPKPNDIITVGNRDAEYIVLSTVARPTYVEVEAILAKADLLTGEITGNTRTLRVVPGPTNDKKLISLADLTLRGTVKLKTIVRTSYVVQKRKDV